MGSSPHIAECQECFLYMQNNIHCWGAEIEDLRIETLAKSVTVWTNEHLEDTELEEKCWEDMEKLRKLEEEK